MLDLLVDMRKKMIYGITFGAFDLLHTGHLHFLEKASKNCDSLIVGLHTDPSKERKKKNSPIQTMYERSRQLSSTKFVDYVIPYDTELDLHNMLATLDVQKRFLGSDYIGQKVSGEEICITMNIEIVYIPRYHNYSSTELRNRLK